MRIEVVTLFPEQVTTVAAYGVTGRAAERGLFELNCRNPRDWTTDVHRTVDDRPFGGGPGMTMKPEPLAAALDHARAAVPAGSPRIYLSPQGRPLTQDAIERFARGPGMVLLAGRYEGVDERVLETRVDEEWSLGDYVLSGGELAAMVLIDAVARLLPGALGAAESAADDSFADALLEGPQYTRPADFEGRHVPPVLLSGDHAAVARWRRREALGRTWLRRPDLLAGRELAAEDEALLDEFIATHRRTVSGENA
jgi:tRNA (guanine37-N1)-methyltransferase